MRKLIAAVVAVLAVGGVLGVSSAQAHVYIKKRSPGEGATVSNDLNKVTAKFTGQLIEGKIKVKRKSSGATVATGGLANAVKVSAPISGSLTDGKYKVKVKLTAADGHQQKFGWGFKVK